MNPTINPTATARLLTPVVGLALALSPQLRAAEEDEAKPKKVMRDAADHDSLVATAREQMAKRVDPFATMEHAEGEDPSVVNRPQDLIARSDILCFNGLATLVPKRAIIHIPAAYQSRKGIQQGARIVNWSEFAVRNRNWVRQHEVDRATAEGRTPFDEETREQFQKSSQVIVATMRGGPISVLPPQEPEEDEAGVDSAAAGQTTSQASR